MRLLAVSRADCVRHCVDPSVERWRWKEGRMKIGNEIKAYRIKHDLSQEDLAHRIGVSHGTVLRWEHGQNEPKSKLIINKLREMKVIP